jgi:ribosomal protein S18 acetylase RimI-like enzyme
MNEDVLFNPIWSALAGEQSGFGEANGCARRFISSVSPFGALRDLDDPQAWRDLAVLLGPGRAASLSGPEISAPAGWEEHFRSSGVQMVGAKVVGAACPEAVVLTSDDVPEMLDLVARAQPGPFEKRTVELGTYLGIRREGRLVAMAGERLRPAGYTEVSAVCTDSEFRGQGFARRLVLAVVDVITRRGAVPMLHVRATNTGAIRLYEQLGFVVHHEVNFVGLRTPDVSTGG